MIALHSALQWNGVLQWDDMRPSARSFDLAIAREVVTDITHELGAHSEWDTVDRGALKTAVEVALLSHFGLWITGWARDVDVNAFGRPTLNAITSANAFIDIAVSAIEDWWKRLNQIEAIFSEIRLASNPRSPLNTLETIKPSAIAFIASRILEIVTARKATYWGLHDSFCETLKWYFDFLGGASFSLPLMENLMFKRFQDSTDPKPPPDLAQTLAADFTRIREATERECELDDARQKTPTPEIYDSLPRWMTDRTTLYAHFYQHFTVESRVALRRDGHRHFVERYDRPRDSQRADAMEVALDLCRASADRDEPLTFARLAEWQAIVLGLSAPPTFRTTDAYTKHSRKRARERFGITSDTKRLFEAALAEANDDSIPIAVRAIRVYHDVCVYHPFADGNERAARLALDHTLSRAGLGLHAGEPIFLFPADRSSSQANVLDSLIGPRTTPLTGLERAP